MRVGDNKPAKEVRFHDKYELWSAQKEEELKAAGFPFTVNSASSFDMGEASGQFTYVEDPDGTWVEFVETHKIPISQKLNWYLDTRKRPAAKALPKWMLKMLRFNRVKD